VSRLTPEYAAPSATVNQVFMVPPRVPALGAGLRNCCGMCYALERVDGWPARFFIARMRASCRHRAAGASLRTVLATIRESPSNPTRAFRRLGPGARSRRTLPSVNARSLRTGVPRDRRSFVLKFCVRGRANRDDHGSLSSPHMAVFTLAVILSLCNSGSLLASDAINSGRYNRRG
jgi:hypothetical protein